MTPPPWGLEGPLRLARVRTARLDDDGLAMLFDAATGDLAPRVRREALARLCLGPVSLARDALARAFSDPVWRVRRDASSIAARLAARGALSLEDVARLAGEGPRQLCTTMHTRLLLGQPISPVPPPPEDPLGIAPLPIFDHDPAVLAARLARLSRDARAALLPLLARTHLLDDGRTSHDQIEEVRDLSLAAILGDAEGAHDLALLSLLDDERKPFVLRDVARLLAARPPALRARLAAQVDRLPAPAARAVVSCTPVHSSLDSYFPLPRHLALSPPRPVEAVAAPASPRPLGPRGPLVSPIALSGRDLSSPDQCAIAIERGINLLFFEPGYDAMTRCVRSLSPRDRARLVIVAGSFEATARGIERDLALTRQLLCVDTIPVFLLFWARSRARLDDQAMSTMRRLAASGDVGLIGVSTHDRSLVPHALDQGADVLMVRMSAAHRGAERDVLPLARRAGAGVLAFTCQCYGLLEAEADRQGVSASFTPASCYRYVLSRPGVSAAIAAPRRDHEVLADVDVAQRPAISQAEIDLLERLGDSAYARSHHFRTLLRAR